MARKPKTAAAKAQAHSPTLTHAQDLVTSSPHRPKRASRTINYSKKDAECSKPAHSSDPPLPAATKKQHSAAQEAETEQNKSGAAEPQSLSKDEEVGGQKQEGDEQEDGSEPEESDSEEEGKEEKRLEYLGEDYYEVEEIRKKRVRKGEVQFLIKWQGWPETANTWEPHENVVKCTDILEEFEKRPSKRPGRRSKRKLVATHTKQHKECETKRDAEINDTVSAPLFLGTEEDQSTKNSSAIGENLQANCTGNLTGDVVAIPETGKIFTGQNGHAKIECTNLDMVYSKANSRLLTPIECTRVPVTTDLTIGIVAEENASLSHQELQVYSKEEQNSTTENGISSLDKEDGGVVVEPKMLLDTEQVLNVSATPVENDPSIAAPILTRIMKLPNDKEENSRKPLGNDHCTGAKKRKSGSVRRVSQNETGHLQEVKAFCSEKVVKEDDNVSMNGDLINKIEQCISEPRIIHPVLENGKEDNEALSAIPKAPTLASLSIISESPTITPYVREIVKAVSYKTSIISGKQHVIVLFKALRSDGQEVIVDNKFLRETYPLLLLDFYEQHLRYSTPH